jgi:NAD(P)-dependent dehydrogenase (short-subunit alcohol dehydrogenase family)
MNLFSLEGRIAFVTGAGSGIGQRIAIGLAEAGASVGCFDLHSSGGLKITREQIQDFKRRAISVTGDVTQAGDLVKAIDVVEQELGPLSLAVNCGRYCERRGGRRDDISAMAKPMTENPSDVLAGEGPS